MELEGEVRRLTRVIDEFQGRWKAPNWRIILDNESPFSEEIMGTMIPQDFRFLDLKYSRKTNPLVHIEHFNNIKAMQCLTQAQRCRVFPLTLDGRVQEWYRKLP